MTEPNAAPALAPRRVLVCGHRSFAARGLIETLRAAGHTVTTFNRGRLGQTGDDVSGPVDTLADNPHLPGPFDAVVNYILLKDEDIARNEAYMAQLLAFCASRHVPHLVHISSVSSYAGRLSDVREDSPVEEVPTRKGSYGSLKVAQDLYLAAHAPSGLAVTFLRPGFIIAPGMTDPIVGMGMRLWWNKLLVFGSAANILPVVLRNTVNQAVARLVSRPAQGRRAFILAHPASPTRRQWLQAVCRELGAGTGTVAFPVPMWRLAGFGGAALATVARMKLKPNQIVRNMCRVQRFDSTATARDLALDLSFDWAAALRQSMDEQTPLPLPYTRIDWTTLPAQRVTFLGYGQIVRQRHLPALRRLGFSGTIDAYDVAARTDPVTGQVVQDVATTPIAPTDLVVVASPGPVHGKAIQPLRATTAPVLVEKPLCYSRAELDEWLAFAGSRQAGVFVCHNFRFKKNVAAMLAHLAAYNPGRLHHVDVLFQSPSIGKEWRTWTKDERRARTLLMDYSVHFLDVACMMATDGWQLGQARHETDHSGYTSLIQGTFQGPYSVSFLLRQGFIPRRAKLLFTFQNYSCSLGFFPDTFVPYMANEGPGQYGYERRAVFFGLGGKVVDKLANRDRDDSHAAAYLAATGQTQLGAGVAVGAMASLYRAVADLGETVYGPWASA